MYSGSFLMVLATPIALGSWWGLAVALASESSGAFWNEEKLLRELLAGYEEYYRSVRCRLIPQIW